MAQIILMFFVGVFLGFGAACAMMSKVIKRVDRQAEISKEHAKKAAALLKEAEQLMNQYEQGK
ncbi:hypothetical protein [Vibrio sp. OPT18]|uniref:hypothetical protein n=1 Tax=Vibrio sp. OPT18 TaxID=2778641 RepID=UPI001882263F|nr:hypothetical protein [Vibrio sp. OPT18]MBE8578688.1 hypothetical protein [Vibrio sp. OPT18]